MDRNAKKTLVAKERLKKVLDQDPRNGAAHHELGLIYFSEGDHHAGLMMLKRALGLEPKKKEYWLDYIEGLIQSNKLEKAWVVIWVGRTLGLSDHDVAKALDFISSNNKVNLSRDKAGVHQLILKECQAVDCLPQNIIDVYAPLKGHYQMEIGDKAIHSSQFAEAEVAYKDVLALMPLSVDAYSKLGTAQQCMGRFSEAVDHYQRAIKLGLRSAVTYSNLGSALKDLGRLEEAEAQFRQAISLSPHFGVARSNLLFSLNYIHQATPEQRLSEALIYGQLVAKKALHTYSSWKLSQSHHKLRIGFVSGDFRSHPVGYFLEALIANIDKNTFELIAYYSAPQEDSHTLKLKSHFDEWQSLMGKSDVVAAKLIHDDAIDILIDLSGHTSGNRLGIFAYKPAPIQITWLGYFATTGLKEIDYLLGDPYVTPECEQHHFSEKIWQLPDSYLCFSPPISSVVVRELPALQNGYITFGCFNTLPKLGDAVIKLWSEILHSVPNSKLFLKNKQLDDPVVKAQLIKRFNQLDIPAIRLILEGVSGYDQYLDSYNQVDIALDPFPYPGGTTTVEGLWMGVPCLTMRGARFISHNCESIAHNSGQADWIAKDERDYLAKAIFFSKDFNSLSIMRAGLREKLAKSPLMDAPRFARNFEKALFGIQEARS